MSVFQEHVINATRANRGGSNRGIPMEHFSYSPKLARIMFNIKKARYYAIGGMGSSGRQSFIDQVFLHYPLYYVVNMPPESRPKLKILYFSMNKSMSIKLQRWTCGYLNMHQHQIMDLDTLNGTSEKMFDIVDGDLMSQYLFTANAFFDSVFDNKIVEFFDGPINPTGIMERVAEYMHTIGHVEKDEYKRETYYPDEEYKDQVTIVIIDNVKHLKSETRHEQYLTEHEMHDKMDEYIIKMRDKYKCTVVVNVPSWPVFGYTKLSQMTPDFRQLKNYYEKSDFAAILFNPLKMDIKDYMGYSIPDFTAEDSIPRFRSLNIIRNTDGKDSISLPYMFFPESGIFSELPPPYEVRALDSSIEFIKTFKHNFIYDYTIRNAEYLSGVERYSYVEV